MWTYFNIAVRNSSCGSLVELQKGFEFTPTSKLSTYHILFILAWQIRGIHKKVNDNSLHLNPIISYVLISDFMLLGVSVEIP